LPVDTVLKSTVVQRPVAVPRKVLGLRVADRSEMRSHTEPVLQGWRLRDYRQIMGDDGTEWYQWTDICVLGEDGVLYKGRHECEQRGHQPMTDTISTSPITAPDEVVGLERRENEQGRPQEGGFCDSIVERLNDLLRRPS
jgi:hypothetical protein